MAGKVEMCPQDVVARPLIPDDLAGEILEAYKAVLSAQVELKAAKETAKQMKEALDAAQGELLNALAEANDPQKKLF